jgi:hypothetical protein
MAVPNYTYLKLKMPGPIGIITVSGSFEQAYACGSEHFKLATAIANSAKLQKLHRTIMLNLPYMHYIFKGGIHPPREHKK